MKRFTETTKWADPWFMDLAPRWKLVWLYLLDQCDNAGVWVPNIKLASVQIGERFQSQEALRVFSGRICVLPSGKWRIIGFIKFQFGVLSRACKPHIPVFRLLESHGISEVHSEESTGIQRVSIPYPKGINTLEEKEKEEDKDKEGDKGVQREKGIEKTPIETLAENGLDSSEIIESWKNWEQHRREIKKPLTPTATQQQIAALIDMGEQRAIAAIRHSIASGWRGIFEPKTGPGKPTKQPIDYNDIDPKHGW